MRQTRSPATRGAGFLLLLALGLAAAAAEAAGDGPARGALLARACLPCHQLEPGGTAKPGPPLRDVFGRRKGALPGYAYSEALRRAGGVWDRAALDAYLAAPAVALPGTSMVFPGLPDAGERADLIAYLAALAGGGARR